MAFNFPDAPVENQLFTPPGGPIYKYNAPTWKALFANAAAPGYVPEAPTDGFVYGRTNATWVQLAGGTGDNTPPGTVIWTARTTPPTGYLKANGAAVSRTTNAALFAAIGTTYGAGDGSTTFNVPDLRGEFVRGFDDGRGVDSGRVQGAAQAESIKAHVHPFTGDLMPTHNHTASSGTESADHTHLVSGNTAVAGTHTHTYNNIGGSGSSTYTAMAGAYNPNVSQTTSGATYTGAGASGADHFHSISLNTGGRSAAHTHAITVVAITAGTPTGTIGNNTGSPAETRPRNITLLACIKT